MIEEAPKTIPEAAINVIIDDRIYRARNGSVLGREGTLAKEYFAKFETISRVHAKITKAAGSWYVTIPSSVINSTLIDGMEAKRDVPHPVRGERVLKLADNCVIRLKP